MSDELAPRTPPATPSPEPERTAQTELADGAPAAPPDAPTDAPSAASCDLSLIPALDAAPAPAPAPTLGPPPPPCPVQVLQKLSSPPFPRSRFPLLGILASVYEHVTLVAERMRNSRP